MSVPEVVDIDDLRGLACALLGVGELLVLHPGDLAGVARWRSAACSTRNPLALASDVSVTVRGESGSDPPRWRQARTGFLPAAGNRSGRADRAEAHPFRPDGRENAQHDHTMSQRGETHGKISMIRFTPSPQAGRSRSLLLRVQTSVCTRAKPW